MKGILYTTLSTVSTVSTGSAVPLGSITRKYGSCMSMSGSTITLSKPGYYEVTASATFAAATAGDVELELQADGTKVSGAEATMTTATTDTNSVSFTGVVRVFCCKPVSLQFVTNGATAPSIMSMGVVVREI